METVTKPWGYYVDYFREDDCVFKKLVIVPGGILSYQTHEQRDEVWFVSAGVATIKTSPYGSESALTNYMMSEMSMGDYILIQKNTAHQIANNQEQDLVIYEMQFGYCSEDDIERLHDPHNRH